MMILITVFYNSQMEQVKTTAHEKLTKFDGDEYWDDHEREMCDNPELDITWAYSESLCYTFNVNFENVRVEVVSWTPPLVIYRGIFTEVQVNDYLNLIEGQSLEPQKIIDKQGRDSISSIRQANGTYTPVHESKATQNLVNTASRLITSVDFTITEEILALSYVKGGHFAVHYDYFDFPETEQNREEFLDENGNRMATFIMVLHKPISGGGTLFPSLGAVVRPEAGDAFLWFNCRRNGELEAYSEHGGCPINAGRKVISTIWLQSKGQPLLEDYSGDESFNAEVFLPRWLV